jgi:hypothetical protein
MAEPPVETVNLDLNEINCVSEEEFDEKYSVLKSYPWRKPEKERQPQVLGHGTYDKLRI